MKAGLAVKVTSASRLLCNFGTITTGTGDDAKTSVLGGEPSITVTEGFGQAFEDAGTVAQIGSTNITIKMNNLPKGVNLRWPETVNFTADPDDNDDTDPTWSTLMLTDASRQTAGIPNADNSRGAGNEVVDGDTVAAKVGDEVTYTYASNAAGRTGEGGTDVRKLSESFKITFQANIAKGGRRGERRHLRHLGLACTGRQERRRRRPRHGLVLRENGGNRSGRQPG